MGIIAWLKKQWPNVNDCQKCHGTGVVETRCECQPKGEVVFIKEKCFCGRGDVVAQVGLENLCTFHNQLFTYHKPAYNDERKKYPMTKNTVIA